MTALLLVFTTSIDLTSIEYVHVSLIVRQAKSPLYEAKSIPDYIKYIDEDCQHARLELVMEGSKPSMCSYCMFLYNFDGMMAGKTDPPYCLVYAIIFKPSVSQEEHNHYNFGGVPHGAQINECTCHALLHHIDPVHDHWQKHCEGCLVIPHGVQYDCPLLKVVIPHNRYGLCWGLHTG